MTNRKYLNIGCSIPRGQYKQVEWVNVDMGRGNMDVKGDMLALPFASNHFEQIHCVHVLEHVTRDKISVALSEMYRVLRPGGKAYIEVPDFYRQCKNMVKAYERNDKKRIHIFRTAIYGKTEIPGMSHHFGFDEDTLREYMEKEGFSVSYSQEMISKHYRDGPVILAVGGK